MAKKTSSSPSPGNDTILGKARHLVRRFSWDMDDQPLPPSNSGDGDEPEDDLMTPTDTPPTTPPPPLASLKRSTTTPAASSSPAATTAAAAVKLAGGGERTQDVEYWQNLFDQRGKSTDADIQTLDIEYDELAQAWKLFQDSLHPSARMTSQEPRTADDVIRVVRAAEREWSLSKHKAQWEPSRLLLNRFCATLPSHSAILRAFSYGDEYVNLFYDVLQSVIKVSVDHRKVTEDLARSLVEVDEAIECCIKEMEFYSPGIAMGAAAKLYSTIFLFLQEVLGWYTRKVTCRLLGSMNEDLYADLHGVVTSITQMWIPKNGKPATAVSAENAHKSALVSLEEARMGKVGKKGYYRKLAGENTLTRQLIYDMQQDARERDWLSVEKGELLGELLNKLGLKLHGLLGPKGRLRSSEIAATLDPASDTTAADAATTPPTPAKQRGSKHKITNAELQFSSKDLQDFFHNDEQMIQSELTDEIFADGLALVPLGEWTIGLRSQVACVNGAYTHASTLSPTTLISAYYASIARRMNLPVISHFCSPSSRTHNSTTTKPTPTDGLSPASQGLISLGYSLIRQLIDLSPPVLDFDSSCDLSPERFAALMLNHGTLKTWTETVLLIQTLLAFAPPVLILIVDGVDCLLDSGDASTAQSLKGLVDALRKHASRTNHQSFPPTNVCKVLFTTSGGSRALRDIFPQDEVINVDNLRIVHPS